MDTCDAPQVPSPYQEGDTVYCWAPKVTPPPSFYKCHNPECIKIIDPAIDSKESVAWKAGKILVGWCLFVVFLLILVPSLCYFIAYLLSTKRRHPYPQPHRAAPVGIYRCAYDTCQHCFGAGKRGLFGPVGMGMWVNTCTACDGTGLSSPPQMLGHALEPRTGPVTSAVCIPQAGAFAQPTNDLPPPPAMYCIQNGRAVPKPMDQYR